MKTYKKVLIIVFISLLALVVIAFAVGFVISGFDLAAMNSNDISQYEMEMTNEFNSIDIRTLTARVELRLSDDGKCHVQLTEREATPFSVDVNSDGQLVIEETMKDAFSLSFMFRIDLFDTGVVVCLPKEEYDSIKIQTNTGNVNVASDLKLEHADIETDTGKVSFYGCVGSVLDIKTDTGIIKLDGVTAKDILTKCDTGAVELTSVNADSIDIEVSTGSVTLSDTECESISVNSTTGSVTLRNTECDSMSVKASTGSIRLSGVIADKTLLLRNNTGSVELTDCDSKDIDIETKTGSIEGSLLSDKIFSASSNTGNVNVPPSAGEDRCRLHTSTGSINITIKS